MFWKKLTLIKKLVIITALLAIIIAGGLIWHYQDILRSGADVTPSETPRTRIIVKFKTEQTDEQITQKIVDRTGGALVKIEQLIPDNPEFSTVYLLDFGGSEVSYPSPTPTEAIEGIAVLPPSPTSPSQSPTSTATPTPISEDNDQPEEIGSWRETVINSLLQDESVDYAEEDIPISIALEPNDPYYKLSNSWGQSFPDLWGIKKIQSSQAWNTTTGSNSVVVAVIDSGVDYNHPDLKDNILRDSKGKVIGWDFVNGDSDPMDDNGHGTHVAGTIGAIGNNGTGVVGVNWKVKIMPLKFLDSGGSGFASDAARAIVWSADHGAKISNNSWGGYGYNQIIDSAVKYAYGKGAIFVAAAGNNGSDALRFTPAMVPEAITVSAFDYNDIKASFSNFGSKIDVAAPGVSILSLRAGISPVCNQRPIIGTKYCVLSGTSMATPHVTGLAALIKTKNPTFTNEQIRQVIRSGSDDVFSTGWDLKSGFGRINLTKSLQITSPLSSKIKYYSRDPNNTRLVKFFGTANGPNFASYELSYTTNLTSGSWTHFITSVQPVSANYLGQLDMSNLPVETNYIKLQAKNTANQVYNDYISVAETAIKGRVYDILTKQPISGAGVNLKQGNPRTTIRSTWTGTDGTYTFAGLPSLNNTQVRYYDIEVSHGGRIPGGYLSLTRLGIRVEPNEIKKINFALTKASDAALITGKVTNVVTNQPIANAKVTFILRGSLAKSVFSTADGTFTLPSVAIGIYDAYASSNGYLCLPTVGLRLFTAKQTVIANFPLTKTTDGGTIKVKVTDSSNRPISNSDIFAWSMPLAGDYSYWLPINIGHTDINGNYTITGLPSGNYYLQTYKKGFISQSRENLWLPARQTVTVNFSLSPF